MASIAQLLLKINGDDDGAESAFDRLQRRLGVFDKSKAEATADVDTTRGSSKVDELARKLAGIDKTPAQARVEVQSAAAEQELRRVEQRLEKLSAQEPSPKVTLQTARAIAQAERLEAKIAALAARGADVNVDVDRDGRATGALSRLTGAAGGAGGALTRLGSTAGGAARPIGLLGTSLSVLPGVLVALAPLAAATGLAIAGLVSSLLGVGAAVAAGAAPALLRFASVLELIKAKQAEQQAAGASAAAGDSQAAANAEQLRSAGLAVAAAYRQRIQAARALAAAEKAASEDIADAHRDVADAQARLRDAEKTAAARIVDARRAVTDATARAQTAQVSAAQRIADAQTKVADAAAAVRDATAAAYDAITRSVQRTDAAVRGLADSQASLRDANFGVKQAAKDLAEFRKEAGLAGQEFDGLFAALSNPDIDAASYDAALAQIAGAKGYAAGSDAALKLEGAVLNVQKARQRETAAVRAVTDATTELSAATANQTAVAAAGVEGNAGVIAANQRVATSTAELAALQRAGVAGASEVVAANRAVAESRAALADLEQAGVARAPAVVAAQRSLSDATRDLNELERAGVERAPAVIAARESLADANRSLSEAQRQVVVTQRQQAAAAAAISAQSATYLALREDATAEELAFADAAQRALGVLQAIGKESAGPIFSALTAGINQLLEYRRGFAAFSRDLGAILGRNIRALFADFRTDPAWASGLEALAGGAKRLVDAFSGSILRDTLAILRNLAVAFLPMLESGVDGFAGALTRLREKTSNVELVRSKMRGAIDTIGSAIEKVRAFIGIVAEIGRIQIAAFRIAMPVVKPIIDALRSGIRAVEQFVSSGEAASSLGPIFTKLGEGVRVAIGYAVDVMRRLIEAVRPALPILTPLAAFVGGVLKGAFAALKPVVDVALLAIRGVAEVLGFLGRLLTPVSGALEQLGVVVGTVAGPGIIGALGKAVKLLGEGLSFLPGVFGLVGRATSAAGSAIVGAAGVVERLLGWITKLVNLGLKPFQLGFQATERVVGGAMSAISGVVSGGLGGIGDAFNAAKNAVGSVTSSLWSGVRTAFTGGFGDILRTAGAKLGDLVGSFTGAWSSVFRGVGSGLGNVAAKIGEGIQGALDTVWSFGQRFFDAGRALMENIGRGIANAFQAVYDKLKGFVGFLRGLLPGSEPKDPRSPLRNLAHAGQAMLQNFADGIPAGAAQLRRALASELTVVPRLATATAGQALAGAAGSSSTSTTYNVAAPTVVGAGLPDPGHWTAALEQQLRASGGLAIQH